MGNADPARRLRIVPRWRKRSVEFQSPFAEIRDQGAGRNYQQAQGTHDHQCEQQKTDFTVAVAMQTASPSIFTLKSGCEKTLAPGESCKVKVTLKPTTTTPQTGVLMVYDNLPNSPQPVPLSGTGKPPKAK